MNLAQQHRSISMHRSFPRRARNVLDEIRFETGKKVSVPFNGPLLPSILSVHGSRLSAIVPRKDFRRRSRSISYDLLRIYGQSPALSLAARLGEKENCIVSWHRKESIVTLSTALSRTSSWQSYVGWNYSRMSVFIKYTINILSKERNLSFHLHN